MGEYFFLCVCEFGTHICKQGSPDLCEHYKYTMGHSAIGFFRITYMGKEGAEYYVSEISLEEMEVYVGIRNDEGEISTGYTEAPVSVGDYVEIEGTDENNSPFYDRGIVDEILEGD